MKILISGKFLFLLLSFSIAVQSLVYCQAKPVTKYYMPDGKLLNESKLDSVLSSWGPNVLVKKQAYGADSVVIHLIKQTDEQMKAAIAGREQETKAMNALLNNEAPDFKLNDISGKAFNLKALRGKVVVLNFWFNTCPPCIAEMPNLNKIKADFQDGFVIFFGLSYNKPDEIKSFLKQHAFNFTLLAETKPVDKLYHITGYPTTLVIDKKGTVRFLKMGGENIFNELKSAVLKARKA